MVIKNLENKVKLVTIICSLFLVGCVLISISSIWTAKNMVVDAQNKIYVLDGNVPILVQRTTMDETLDVEAKSHIEMFHHYFFTLAPDDKYIKYTMEKAMYLVDETGLALGLEKEYEGDMDDWSTMIDTNIKGLLTMTRLIVPGMVKRNEGHVINVGSVAGDAAYAGGNVYCATKAAVKAITDGLRIDVAESAVRVTNLKPGLVETNFSNIRFHGDNKRAENVYKGIKPLTGEDIADVAFYAASAPKHVQIAEVLILATHQASGSVIHREK